MGKLRTPEQLKQLFQQAKERKEKELQLKKEEKKRQYQELCKQADQLLKEDQERLKKEKIEQLQALSKKTSQNALKRFQINLFNNRWIDDDKHTRNLSREELEKMQPNHINWQKWSQVVEQTKQKIKDMGIDLKPSKDSYVYEKRPKHTALWVYDGEGKLMSTFDSYPSAASKLNISVNTITMYARQQRLLKAKGLRFSNKPIESL